MAVVSQRGSQRIRAGEAQDTVLLHLSLDYEREYLVGKKRLFSDPGVAVLLPPCHTYSTTKPGGQDLSLAISHTALMSLINERWAGRSGHCALKPTELQVTGNLKRFLSEATLGLIRGSSMSQKSGNPRLFASFESDLLDLIAEQIAVQNGVQPLSSRRRARIESLERWIDANLHADLSLESLAQVSRVKPHTLTKTTLAARGVTPTELVRSRRLTATNHLLMTGSKSVSDAAHACGFSHLGRFAAAYRQAFGETPSDTLRKLKRRIEPSTARYSPTE